MRKIVKKRGKKAGLSPGTLVHVGEKRDAAPTLAGLTYHEGEIEYLRLKSVDDIPPVPHGRSMWIHIDGLHDIDLIEALGKRFNLHSAHIYCRSIRYEFP